MSPHSSWWTRWPGSRLAGWQAGRLTKCQGRLVTQAWKVFLRLANLRPWLFFLVSNPSSPEPLQLHRATSFALKNGQSVWTSCCGRARLGKYAQESDSMTRRVNRFTNTTKLAIYKSSELRGNYWWVFWRMDKWQRWTIHCQPNPLTASNAWFCHFELNPKIVPWAIFPFASFLCFLTTCQRVAFQMSRWLTLDIEAILYNSKGLRLSVWENPELRFLGSRKPFKSF